MKILIVDDKEENLYMLESLLKGNSYHVLTAENGAQALEKLYLEGADMIISDILMPEMDGFQFCRAVHKDDQLKDIPFIFYTATYTDYKDEEFALKCGANWFVRKPIEPDEFLRIIKDAICDVENGKIAAKEAPLKDEEETYKLYSERLVKKLEKKMFDLESALAKQKKTEEKINRVNRAYEALNECSGALIRAATEEDLLGEMCRIIVETGGYRMAWVGFADEDENRTVRPVAQAGYEEGYLDTLNLTWADTERGQSPVGTAIRTGKPVFMRNILTDPVFSPWRKDAAKRGYISNIAFPLIEDGKTFGALSIYSVESYVLDKEEERLLKELADDLAYGVVSIRNRNKREKAEQELRYQLHFLQEVMDSIPSPVFFKDKQGIYRGCNRAFEAYLGLSKQEIVGKGVYDLSPKDLADKYHEMDTALLNQGGVQVYEGKVRYADGTIHDVIFNKAVFAGKDGSTGGLVGVMLEITDRKRAERELRQSEEKYRELIENINDVVFSMDAEGILTYVSPVIESITGYRSEEVIGEHFTKFIHKEDVEFIASELNELIRGVIKPSEYRIVGKFGELIWVRSSSKAIFDKETFVGVQGIMTDITLQKKAEEDRKKFESKLIQAQRMESIGTLAGGIAHDFNNILSAILGYTELAIDKADAGEVVLEDLREVLMAGLRAKDLVKQILAFSRQSEQELRPVQVKLIAKEVLKLIRSSLPATIEICENIQSDTLVMADPAQIHQVMMNLCTNAGHAMQEKGGILKVDLADVRLDAEFASKHPDVSPGCFLRVTVSDTGNGIPPDIMDRIFDPFFTTKEKGEGTGLGLAVVHGIVKSLKGIITAYSDTEKGTTFNIFLPVMERGAIKEERIEKPLPTGIGRILLVDDEPTLLNLGKKIIESLGYQVEVRSSAVEALELFKASPERFDLVITDMTMPNMTGEQLSEQLMAVRSDIPVILCTGFSAKIDEKKARAMGIRAFAFKPMLKRDIAVAIRKVLDE